MRNFSEENATEAVLARLEGADNPRLKEIMTSVIKHLHAVVRETEPSEEEWFEAIRFLTAVGQMCDDKRQEFILLSDVLGVSMLIDAIHHGKPLGATESAILGPFYVEGAEFMQPGASVRKAGHGDPLIVSGRVLTPAGNPIPVACLDVWQTAGNAQYDILDPNQPEMNMRGRFLTDGDGRFHFRSVVPCSYPVPSDGPVGRLLRQMGRHPYRPAHIHVIVSAEGYERLTTQLFVDGDPYLDSDAVFGVKDSLVAEFVRHDDGEDGKPYYTMEYDFGLSPSGP